MIAHAANSSDNVSAGSQRMRILVIAPQPFYTPRGTPLSVYYRTAVLAHTGTAQRIDLLTYGQGEDVDYSDADVPEGVRVIRIPRFGIRHVKVGPSLAKAFLDVFMFLYSIALLLRHRHDVVHAHEESVFWCRFLKPLFRFRLIYDMHSSLPQQLTNFKFTQSKLLIGAFDRLERTCLKASDAVITICPDLEEYALKQGVDSEKHFLIENSIFDDVRLRASRKWTNSSHEESSSPEKNAPTQRIVYAGTFEPYQGIDLLLQAFAGVIKRRAEAELLLIGGTPPQIEAMTDLAVKLGLSKHCRFLGQTAKSDAMQHVRSATVLVSPRVHGTNTPLKIYEMLASGVPMVATRIWSHTQVLTDDVCILVEPNPEAMAQGLNLALTDEARRASISKAARALYERRYSRTAYESKMEAMLQCLVKPKRTTVPAPRAAPEGSAA